MNGLGQRLRERAKELGLADATVAERLGLSQQRYHNYISDLTEPDFETLVRICRALAMEPNVVLGVVKPVSETDEAAVLRARITAATGTMAVPALRLTAAVVDTLSRQTEPGASSPSRATSRRPARQIKKTATDGAKNADK